MKKVIVGVGIPGSGKTTFLKKFAQKNNYTYISPDDIRVELTENASDQTENAEVWRIARERLSDALSKNKNVVFDATFAKDFERKDFLKYCRERGASKIQGVFLSVPFEIANAQNKARKRVVPEHAMKRMHDLLKKNPPLVEDGFDSVMDLNQFQKITHAEMKREGKIIYKKFTA